MPKLYARIRVDRLVEVGDVDELQLVPVNEENDRSGLKAANETKVLKARRDAARKAEGMAKKLNGEKNLENANVIEVYEK